MMKGHIGPHANINELKIYTSPISISDSESIVFNDKTIEIMRLDNKGMIYKGKRIEDAGKAHKIFLEVMDIIKKNL